MIPKHSSRYTRQRCATKLRRSGSLIGTAVGESEPASWYHDPAFSDRNTQVCGVSDDIFSKSVPASWPAFSKLGCLRYDENVLTTVLAAIPRLCLTTTRLSTTCTFR